MPTPHDITDVMLREAADSDDLDAALLPIMNFANITDGGVAGVAFSAVEDDWEGTSHFERMSALRAWRDMERRYSSHTERALTEPPHADLVAALERLLSLNDMMMQQCNLPPSFLSAECIQEMNEAPNQARAALALAEERKP